MDLPRTGRNPRNMTDRAVRSRARASDPTDPFPIQAVRRLRFRNGVFCPRCGHRRVHRWGRFHGRFGSRRRYRCLGCGRTFSDLTGTPLAYLKHLDRWRRFCGIALGHLTVRGVAERLGIHRTTSFRWRHLLLDRLRMTEILELGGRVSLETVWLPFSAKGSRRLPRPARRRRFDGIFSFETRVEWIVIACDNRDASFATTVGPSRPRHRAVRAAVEPALATPVALVCRRNRLIPFGPVARAFGVPLELEYPANRETSPDQEPERGRIYMVRVRRWLKRFRGVASRYLDHYLLWFRILGSVP